MRSKHKADGAKICYRRQEGITYVFWANRPAPQLLLVPLRRSFECVEPYPEVPRFKECPTDVFALIMRLRTIPGLQRVRLNKREITLVAMLGTVSYEVPRVLQAAQQEVERYLTDLGWRIVGEPPVSARRRAGRIV